MASEAAERTAAALPGAERAHLAPPQQQQPVQPGREYEMQPKPLVIRDGYRGSSKLASLAALVTGACALRRLRLWRCRAHALRAAAISHSLLKSS